MVETWFRWTGSVVRVGGADVFVNMREEYNSENPDVPVRVRMNTASGLMTEGPPAAAWREMLKLLGIAPPPAPPATTESAEPEKSTSDPPPEPSLQPAESLPEVPPPTLAPSPALAPANAEESPRNWQEQEEEDEEEDEVEPEEERLMSRNIVRDSLIKLLNSPVEKESDSQYDEGPPPEITAEDVACIPNLATSADAAAFIDAVEQNLELAEMRAQAAEKAKKLKYLKKANRSKRCEHVKFNDEACGSPALRGERFCHFHAAAHAPNAEMPVIEDQRSLQIAFTKLAQQVATNKIDAAQAKLLLQILETAGRNLPAEGL